VPSRKYWATQEGSAGEPQHCSAVESLQKLTLFWLMQHWAKASWEKSTEKAIRTMNNALFFPISNTILLFINVFINYY